MKSTGRFILETLHNEWIGNILLKKVKSVESKVILYPRYLSMAPYAFLREMMGSVNAMLLPYEEPETTALILRDHLRTCMEASQEVIKTVRPDCGFVWEDCCGSSGPFISPQIFDEQFAWWYREWKDYLLSMGIKWIVLDSDGDVSPLVKRWYDAGVDCLHPWEVNAVDMLRFAQEYPDFCMMGGIYKHIFEPESPTQVGKFRCQ